MQKTVLPIYFFLLDLDVYKDLYLIHALHDCHTAKPLIPLYIYAPIEITKFDYFLSLVQSSQ